MIIAPGYDTRRQRLLAELATGATVLDIGFAQQPNPFLKQTHRVGLDLVAPSLSSGTRYEEETIGDAQQVATIMSGRLFETIICAELIEHLENPYALLRDLRPLLKNDGRLLISTPNPLAFPVVVIEFLQLKRYFYTSDHLYYFLPRWVERMLNSCGFDLEFARPVGLWTPWFTVPFVPVALSYQVIYVARKR